MIGCPRARRRLWVFLEGGPIEPWLKEHLRQCPSCAEAAAQLRSEGNALECAAVMPPLPDADALWARIDARLPRQRRFPWFVLAPLAPAALVAALWAFRGPAPVSQAPAARVAAAHPQRSGNAVVAAVGPSASPSPVRVAPPVVRHPLGARHAAEPRARRHAPVMPVRRAERRRLAPVTEAIHVAAGEPAPEPPVAAPACDTPVAAVVVVHRPDAGTEEAGADRTFCRSESRDPVSGEVMRLAVSRETDAGGTTHISIKCVVQPAVGSGAISEPET